MNLRVFSDGGDLRLIEVSSRSLPYHRRLFVPMLPAGAAATRRLRDLDASILVPVEFEGQPRRVCFLLVNNLAVDEHDLEPIGVLSDDDSRNVLNNLLDILAFRD